MVGFVAGLTLVWEHRMTFSQFTVSIVVLFAMSSVWQATVAAAEDGQLAFNNVCRTCHTLKEGDNRLGPNLHKIIGRKAGSLANYSYSTAMKGADLVWDRATLDRFISNPDQVVPGNNMKPFGGLSSAEDRAKIITFLEADSGS
jgi:cytochrome c